jgi:hypothetical protein
MLWFHYTFIYYIVSLIDGTLIYLSRKYLGINGRLNNLHYPTCNLTAFQKGTHYLGIKVFNSLPLSIKNIVYDMKQFKFALKRFLLLN